MTSDSEEQRKWTESARCMRKRARSAVQWGTTRGADVIEGVRDTLLGSYGLAHLTHQSLLQSVPKTCRRGWHQNFNFFSLSMRFLEDSSYLGSLV